MRFSTFVTAVISASLIHGLKLPRQEDHDHAQSGGGGADRIEHEQKHIMPVNNTYEEVTFTGVALVSNYKSISVVKQLKYETFAAFELPTALAHLPIPRPYGKIVTMSNNGSTITPVHPYSNVTSVKPLSATLAIVLDTQSLNLIPVVGTIFVRAYKRDKHDAQPVLMSEARCAFRNEDQARLEFCKFPKEWKDVVLLEFAVRGEGKIALISDVVAAAQASFNLQAFIPDVVPSGTVGFLMDNLVMEYTCAKGFDNDEEGLCV